MSGLLEPVGPEDSQTYWVRRGIVAAAAVIVVVIVVVAVTAIRQSGANQTTANPPANGPVLAPAQTPTQTPAQTPAAQTTPNASAPASAQSSGSSSAPASGQPSGSATAKATSPSAKASSSPSATATGSAGVVACAPASLRTTITGPRTVKVGTPVTFEAGVVNTGSVPCRITITTDNYEFRIFSGTDRIWTTKDCSVWLPKVNTVLAPQADVRWQIKWTVQRSQNCAFTRDTLRAGTYAANSLLTGAKPAQLVMQLS